MIKLGKQASNSELLEGREKLQKDFVCENPVILENVLHGNNPEDGTEFLTALVTTLDGVEAYVRIPATSIDVFNEITPEDVEKEFSTGKYYLYMEKKRNRRDTRDYYVAWIEKQN